jgi:hypothetical protein
MKFIILIICLIVFSLIFSIKISAVTKVNGYYKKNGTYVQPYYRSDADSTPYNNWSYPGNVNPYTGKLATGDPDTYLKRYKTNYIGSGSDTQNIVTTQKNNKVLGDTADSSNGSIGRYTDSVISGGLLIVAGIGAACVYLIYLYRREITKPSK